MKKLGLNILVIGFLLSTNAFADGTCSRSQGYWEPIVAESVAQIKERSDTKKFSPYRTANWGNCFQDSIVLSKTYVNTQNIINFTDWDFKEDDQSVVAGNKYQTTIKGMSWSGSVDAQTNPQSVKTEDQRFYKPGETFWECIVNFADQNGNSQAEITAEVLNRDRSTGTLRVRVFNSYLVAGTSETQAKEACELQAAIELVKQQSFVKAVYSITDSTNFISSLSFMGRSTKEITQDEALDLLNEKNIQVSVRK